MPVITIREGQQTDSGFGATLSLEGQNYPDSPGVGIG